MTFVVDPLTYLYFAHVSFCVGVIGAGNGRLEIVLVENYESVSEYAKKNSCNVAIPSYDTALMTLIFRVRDCMMMILHTLKQTKSKKFNPLRGSNPRPSD